MSRDAKAAHLLWAEGLPSSLAEGQGLGSPGILDIRGMPRLAFPISCSLLLSQEPWGFEGDPVREAQLLLLH